MLSTPTRRKSKWVKSPDGGIYVPRGSLLDVPSRLLQPSNLFAFGGMAFTPIGAHAAAIRGSVTAAAGGQSARDYDGSSDFQEATANLVTTGDGKVVCGSCWIEPDTLAITHTILDIANGKFRVQLIGANVHLRGRTSGGTTVLSVTTDDTPITVDVWNHITWSVDLAASTADITVDRVQANITGGTITDTAMNLSNSFKNSVAASNGANLANGALSEIWMDTDFIDFTTSANLDKVITSGLVPVELGDNGENVIGSTPESYFKDGDGTNAGNGGNLTEQGAPLTVDGPGV